MTQPATLVRRAREGDAAAFEQLLALHERRVLLTALRLLGSVEDAKDAAQEVFLRLHKHLGSFDDTRDVTPWLYRVAINVCRDLLRERRRRGTVPLDQAPEPAVAGRVHETVARDEQRRLVKEALAALGEKERAAVVLRDIEGLATGEVARILGSSEATVRSQVSTARVKIKKFLRRSV